MFHFNQVIQLYNDRVLIRPLAKDDFQYLLPIALEHKHLLQYSPTSIHTADLLKEYIESALAEKDNLIRYPFVIYDKQQQAFAGSTSFAAVSNKDKRLEIGWTWLGQSFQQTGLNRHCKFLMLQFAFEEIGFERVEFKTDERNLQSRTAIQKIGGREEGILRSHTVMADGYRRNTVYYSILKTEWQLLKQTVFKSFTTLTDKG